MKGIILAGGLGTRMAPVTNSISKHLIPVFDKPMIYYSLSVLLMAKIKEIVIITRSKDLNLYKELFGNGSQLGISISYLIQDKAKGIADAFLIAEDFIGDDSVSLILGDNIFYGQGFSNMLSKNSNFKKGAKIYTHMVSNPESFGVLETDDTNKPIQIHEKPNKFISNNAVTGLYFYDNDVIEIAKSIKTSNRGELEITSINNEYIRRGDLEYELLGRGYAWLDTGTFEGLIEASMFVQTIEKRQGYKIGCIEEIAYKNKWINDKTLLALSKKYKNNYGNYIKNLIESG